MRTPEQIKKKLKETIKSSPTKISNLIKRIGKKTSDSLLGNPDLTLTPKIKDILAVNPHLINSARNKQRGLILLDRYIGDNTVNFLKTCTNDKILEYLINKATEYSRTQNKTDKNNPFIPLDAALKYKQTKEFFKSSKADTSIPYIIDCVKRETIKTLQKRLQDEKLFAYSTRNDLYNNTDFLYILTDSDKNLYEIIQHQLTKQHATLGDFNMIKEMVLLIKDADTNEKHTLDIRLKSRDIKTFLSEAKPPALKNFVEFLSKANKLKYTTLLNAISYKNIRNFINSQQDSAESVNSFITNIDVLSAIEQKQDNLDMLIMDKNEVNKKKEQNLKKLNEILKDKHLRNYALNTHSFSIVNSATEKKYIDFVNKLLSWSSKPSEFNLGNTLHILMKIGDNKDEFIKLLETIHNEAVEFRMKQRATAEKSYKNSLEGRLANALNLTVNEAYKFLGSLTSKDCGVLLKELKKHSPDKKYIKKLSSKVVKGINNGIKNANEMALSALGKSPLSNILEGLSASPDSSGTSTPDYSNITIRDEADFDLVNLEFKIKDEQRIKTPEQKDEQDMLFCMDSVDKQQKDQPKVDIDTWTVIPKESWTNDGLKSGNQNTKPSEENKHPLEKILQNPPDNRTFAKNMMGQALKNQRTDKVNSLP